MTTAQETTVAAWSRGVPMAERLRPPPDPPEDPDDPQAGAAAERRLQRWRQQEPFSDRTLWHARLRGEGLDETTLRHLLVEPAEALARRLPEPEWARWATATNATPEAAQTAGGAASPAAGGPPPAPLPVGLSEQQPFFTRAVRPLLDQAYARLWARLEEVTSIRPGVLVPQRLVDQLFPALLWRVHAMLTRALTLELHLARLAGELPDDPGQRFEAFLAGMEHPARRERLLADYPVLARQLWLAVDQWVTNGARMAERVVADYELLGSHFAGGTPIGQVKEIRPGAGDRHKGGQSVATVSFDSGLVVVYKPRPLAIDVHFAQLLDWLYAAGLSLPLRVPACLDRGAYGWAEFISPRPCRDQAEIRRFYRRQGSLLALLELLRANDVHAENLIAAGDHPVLVDLETLLQPWLPLDEARATPAEQRAGVAARTSVLHVGLLPALAWQTHDGRAVDISGLGNRPGQQTPMALPVLSDVGTDTMRVRLQRVEMDLPDHRPVPKDAELNLLDYADDITAGYAEMHTLCRERRDDLLAEDGPLSTFGGDPVRVLVRSTVIYTALLQTGFHPDVLRDGLERDRHFDFLWRRVADTPSLAAVAPAERRDLWCGDVPYFTGRPGSASLFDSHGEPVSGFMLVPALDLVRRDLLTRDERHLAGQLDLIRGSLAAAAINASNHLVYPSYTLPPADGEASVDELVVAAQAIGDTLASAAFVAGGTAQWLGLSSQAGSNWSLGPLSPDLFNGIAGVALFLAELGRRCGSRRYTDLARHAAATVHSQLARNLLVLPDGMAGQPGLLYALCRLGVLLEDETMVDRAVALCADLRRAPHDDANFDVVGGSAGTIAAVRILHLMRPDGPAAEVIAAAAERLVAAAHRYPGGWGWLPASIADQGLASVPLAGFGHGNAGIAWSLGHAATLLGVQRYADLGREATAYERGLFDPDRGAWRDLRMPDRAVGVSAWCHGSVGIGLARLDSCRTALSDDPGTAEDIDAALASASSDGFGMSHCLCHGDTGTIDLFLTAAAVLDQPSLRAEANQRARQVLRSIATGGPICGVPFGNPTPSLMVGLAGIGYGLLRVAAPHHVPSVLLLQPEGDAHARAA